MIRFSCPACQANLEVSEALSNQLAACADCGRKIRVPLVSPKSARKQRTGTKRNDSPGWLAWCCTTFGELLIFIGGGTALSSCWAGRGSAEVSNAINTDKIVGAVVGVGMALGGVLLVLGVSLFVRLDRLLEREDDKS